MSKTTIKGETIKEYLAKYPQLPSRTLATMIYDKENPLFTSKEQVYSAIRRYRGNHGIKNRKDLADKQFASQNERVNPYELPKAITSDTSPFILPNGTWLIMADVHIPFHDEVAIECMVQWAQKHCNIDGVLMNGDIMDCYQVSTFCKDPRLSPIDEELETMGQFLDYIKHKFKKAMIVYKQGNHENRLERYLMQKAPELYGLEELRIQYFLKLKDKGITFVPEFKVIDADNVYILHGHEYRTGFTSPVNPARGMFLKAKECVISAHEHRTSNHNEQTIKGKLLSTWSMGCLCELKPQYRPLNQWNHGFGILELKDNQFEYDNRRIIAGKVY